MHQRRIPLQLIYGNPDQPRRTFRDPDLRELAESIGANGLKQPITVRPDDDGMFMIVMGERRFRAHQLLASDGHGWAETILCMVSSVDDKQLAIDAIIENDQRVDVAPLEQAQAYQRMLDQHGFSAESLAMKLGKPLRRIRERLDLLRLTPECQAMFAAGQLNPTQAWHLSSLEHRHQDRMLRAIATGQCKTNEQLYALSAAITAADAQDSLFGDLPPPASDEDRRIAAGFEARLERMSAMLRDAIDGDQTVIAVRRVDPTRAGTVADLLAAMVTDFRRLETAFRVAAAGATMAEG